jgi:hypothetical protein
MPSIVVVEWISGGLSVGFHDGGEEHDGQEFIRIGLGWDGSQVSAIRKIPRSQLASVRFLKVEEAESVGL